jgi:alkaline phosphatase D
MLPQTDAVGARFMASSVTFAKLSEILTRIGYLGPGVTDLGPIMKGSNPHLEFFNSDTHGYNVMTVTKDDLTCLMVSVNPVKERPGVRTNLRRFLMPADEYLIQELPV